MTEHQFNEKVRQILSKIECLPETQRSAILAMAEDTRKRHLEIQEATARACAALDDWRLAQKYRIFDAEASLREAGVREREQHDSE